MGRLMGFVGLLVIFGIAWLISTDRRAIRRKTVLWGLGLMALIFVGFFLTGTFFDLTDTVKR